MPEIEELLEVLEEDATDGIFATGVQVFASIGGSVIVDHAFGTDGLGRDMSTARVHRIHCAGKPITALGIAALVDDGELSYFDRIGNVVGYSLPAGLADLTIDELLSHRAGLFGLPAAQADLLRPAERQAAVWALTPLHRGSAVYSDFAGWYLLARAIESLTGVGAAQFINERILQPMQLENHVLLVPDSEALRSLGYEIAPAVDLSGHRPLPQLAGVVNEIVVGGDVANMSFATMRGLGRMYEALLRILGGGSGVVTRQSLAHLVEASGPAAMDPVMTRECQYGHGFMVNLRLHNFGQLRSEQSFGHSGYRGTTAAFADPTVGICAAMYYNGEVDAESAIGYLRTARFDMLQRCLVSGAE